MTCQWPAKKLGDVCQTGAGGTPLKEHKDYYENGTIPWLMSGEVSQGEVWSSANFITQKGLENSSAKIFPKNTVLVAMYGATAGQVGILRFEAATNQAVCGVLPNSHFVPEFLFYLLLSKKDELVAQAAGNAQPNISQIKIRNTEVPVPPLPEQRRIVGILDEAFEGIATAKANAEKNLQNARALFESHLQSIFALRGDGWPIRKLGELSDQITDGTHNSPPYVKDGIPMLDSKHVMDGFLIDDTAPEKFISPDIDAMLAKRCKPRAGDILISSRGSIGKLAIVREGQNFNIMGNMILIRLPLGVNREFVAFYLSSQITHIESIARGVAQKGLYLNQIRDYELPLPPEAKQAQIGKQLDALSAETQRLASIYQQKLAALDELKKSLLHQAFSGEL